MIIIRPNRRVKLAVTYNLFRLWRFTLHYSFWPMFGLEFWHCYDKDIGWTLFLGWLHFDYTYEDQ